MANLTAGQIRNSKAQEKPYKLSDGHGLFLHVATSGRRTWRYRYKISGVESTYILGEYPKMSLEQARKARGDVREIVAAGINPADVRREKKQAAIKEKQIIAEVEANSFKAIANEWMNQQQDRWSKNHASAVRAALQRDVFPIIGQDPIDTIKPPMVLQVVRNIESRNALEVAHKILQRMNSVFRYAVQTGRATYNPAAEMKGVLKTRKVTHQPALSKEELPEFLRNLSTADIHITTRLALQFTILTAARSGETRGATWPEINLDDAIWRIPGERMKMDSPHTVPLSKQAVAILKRVGQLYGYEGLVFPGVKDDKRQLSENTMLYALYRIGYHSKATVHGFRAVFSTIANESGFDGDVIEKALAHEERNRVRAAYHRSEYIEQRRELMQWWADYLEGLEFGVERVVGN